MFLPCEDNFLRKLTLDRPSYRVGRFDNLPLRVEFDINNLLANEVRLFRRLQNMRTDLAYGSYDFSTYAAFRTIDRYSEGHITIDNLRSFFRNHSQYLSDREALAIVRRMDTDGDAKVGYTEFADFINYQIAGGYSS